MREIKNYENQFYCDDDLRVPDEKMKILSIELIE